MSFSGVEEELVLLLGSGTMGGDDMRDGEYLQDETNSYNPFNSRQSVQKLATTGNFFLEKAIKGPEYTIYWIM